MKDKVRQEGPNSKIEPKIEIPKKTMNWAIVLFLGYYFFF